MNFLRFLNATLADGDTVMSWSEYVCGGIEKGKGLSFYSVFEENVNTVQSRVVTQ